MLQGEASHRSHLWRCKTWSPPCSLLACQTLQRRLIQVRIENPFSKFTPTWSLQAWRLATITRRALTRSTRTTQAPSPTQITEHHLQAVSCQSSSPLQCSLDTQANECVDLSEFYLSRLILYDYGLSHVINCTYTRCYKYSEFCKIWLWKYSKKTYVHSFSFMLKQLADTKDNTALLMTPTLASQPHQQTFSSTQNQRKLATLQRTAHHRFLSCLMLIIRSSSQRVRSAFPGARHQRTCNKSLCLNDF